MMAQGAVANLPTNGTGRSLTAAELREILEYERILQFRDAVLAGTHPRVKIPPYLMGKHRSISIPSHPTPSDSSPKPNPSPLPTNPAPRTTDASVIQGSSNIQRSAGSRIPLSSQSEINPILLEKSDDLIKAEIQLQRQRLERALREQIEQQRITAKALLQTSESLPNFDITEVLSKALAIVHPSTTAEAEASVGAPSSASDSFDENTFYSSQHDTPDASPFLQNRRDSIQPRSGQLEAKSASKNHSSQVSDQEVAMTGTSQSHERFPLLPSSANPQNLHSENRADITIGNRTVPNPTNLKSTTKVIPEVRTRTNVRRPQDTSTGESIPSSEESDDPIADSWGEQGNEATSQRERDGTDVAPLIRNHSLSPFAPQPARVSPLAVARHPPVLQEAIPIPDIQPPQVAALRNDPGLSSTDSSPKGSKRAEKKKEKKRKRKAKAIDVTPESPYIKPEPKSPSPFSAPQFPRPQKRQRQSGQYSAELNYDDSRSDADQHMQRRVSAIRHSPDGPIYEQNGQQYIRIRQRSPPNPLGYGSNEPLRHMSGTHYVRRPESPAMFSGQFNEPRAQRTVSGPVKRRIYEDTDYYKEPQVRVSTRGDLGPERPRSPSIMGPPRQSMRIVIDEYGRKYYEPATVPMIRHSVAPPERYHDQEVLYARTPFQAVAPRTQEGFDGDNGTKRMSSPSFIVPRRVVTQPENSVPAPTDFQSYRQRENSVRPGTMAPPGDDFVQIRGPPIVDRRPDSRFDGSTRDFIQRGVSVRPEQIRYDAPKEFISRQASVQPITPSREYAASIRPEARQEFIPRVEREYSVRPEPHREVFPQGQREYSARPLSTVLRREPIPIVDDGRYYEEVPARAIPRQECVIIHENGHYYEEVPNRRQVQPPPRFVEGERFYEEAPMRRPAEIQYVEQPRHREASVVVYADNSRAPVYR